MQFATTLLFFFFFFFFFFLNPCLFRGTVRVPSVEKGLNNQRMRIIQDIAIATLLRAPVELPTRVYSRKNCFDLNCSFVLEPSLWDVYDEEETLKYLELSGVVVEKTEQEENSLAVVPSLWPVAASHLTTLNVSYRHTCLCEDDTICSFGPKRLDCCLKMIPNTDKGVEVLKNVNYAFQSASKFKVEAKKIISAFKKKTQQGPIISIHWRLDDDFVLSLHGLSALSYCTEVFKGMKIAMKRADLNRSEVEKIHFLILGEADVAKVAKILRSCETDRMDYELHSKETLLSKEESEILMSEYNDVKGQLDFELGSISDIFLGSPFSSFSVLIAFYRFASVNYNPGQTIMVKVDVKDQLARLFEVQFPYTSAVVAKKMKCTVISNLFLPARDALKHCAAQELLHFHHTTELEKSRVASSGIDSRLEKESIIDKK